MGIKYDGGDKIFDPVMDELLPLEEQVGPEVIQRVASKLIGGLLELGWDNADGWPGIYDSEPAVIAAFKEHGILLKCMSEHAEHGGVCEEERGHYPATAHKDDQGWTWGDDEAVQ
jgi:hypothetical protein